MIVRVKDGEIKEIRIGDFKKDSGFIYIPDHWGSKDILSFLEEGTYPKENKSYYSIRGNPEESFELREIRF